MSSTPAWPSRIALGALTAIALSLLLPGAARAQGPKVAASIAPVHSLVAAVMEGVGEPELIMPGATSPHGAALTPGQVSAIQGADLVFWIGERLETHMSRVLATVPRGRVVELGEITGLTPRRPGASAAKARNHAADHDGGTDHGGEAHHDEESHDHAGTDPHYWLDPANVRAMTAAVEAALSKADPDNAARYAANGQAFAERLDALRTTLRQRLEPLEGRGIVVFHDGYAHLVEPFGLRVLAVVNVAPDVPLGAARLRRVRAVLAEHPDACLFAEPQFPDRILDRITDGTSVARGTLDLLGAAIEPGPHHYEALMLGLAGSLEACLRRSG